MDYCVYLTTYLGEELPPNYVGSSSLAKVDDGYHGSVASKAYQEPWERELRENPHLFKTEVLSLHATREEATQEELRYQIEHVVVKDDRWLNLSLAQPDGFFGRDVSGEKNPMYGRSRKGEKHKGGENISAALKELYATSERGAELRAQSSERWQDNNPSQDPEVMARIKQKWKETGRNIGEKNGRFGTKLYNDGKVQKAFRPGEQPEGWIMGTIKKTRKSQ